MAMEELYDAILVAQSGDHNGARTLFEAILPKIGSDAAQNCILAHYMADVQEELEDELFWDLRSLQYLEEVKDERIVVVEATLATAEFFPSVYLNIASCYKRLGNFDESARYLSLAEESCSVLADDGYGKFIRNRIASLGEEIRKDSGEPYLARRRSLD